MPTPNSEFNRLFDQYLATPAGSPEARNLMDAIVAMKNKRGVPVTDNE